jgi:RNA polymerase sigma-70 factor (ECF subfamily)
VPTSTPDISKTEFVAFMQAYQDMVFSTAVRLLGNETQAEDIAQEVFLKAYERFAQLRDSATAGGWLKTVATNLSLNHLSRYRKRWRLFSELWHESDDEQDSAIEFSDLHPLPDSLLEMLLADQRHALIEQSLQQLPQHQRVPLVLWHFEELSYECIAQRLNISLAKVKVDIYRGRAALAKQLMHSELAPDVSTSRSS